MDFFTSDTHFSHTNIIQYCNRPFKSIYEMNKHISERWNSVVGKDDVVYHLGDFAWGEASKHLPFLNGKIILIRGNHDRKSNIKKLGIPIYTKLEYTYNNYKFILNHRPVYELDQWNSIDPNLYDRIICGHVHEKWKTDKKNINVGTDIWDFTPISIDQIINLINNK